MNKLVTALGCLMMLGMTIAPVALAHGNSGQHVQGGPALPAPAGYAGGGNPNPSGFYFGSASLWVEANGLPVVNVLPANSAPGCPTPTGGANPALDAFLCQAFDVDANGANAAAFGLCDMEVLGPGTAVFPVDETLVDGTTGGNAPDGLFNDGGVGAVCHTHATYYAHGLYNSGGCPAGNADAEDLVVGGNIWVSATCDSTIPGATTPLLTRVLSLETCIVNDVLSFDPAHIPTCATTFTGCVVGVPANSCPGTPGGPTICGADGVADASNEGYGGPNNGPLAAVYTAQVTRYATAPAGVPYPAPAVGCGGGSEAAFVWNSVQVTGTTVNVLSAATTGWIQ